MNEHFFDDLPKDLMSDPSVSADTLFDIFNDSKASSVVIKDRDNYIKSIFKPFGFQKEINIDNSILSTFFASDESATCRSKENYSDEDENKLVEIRFIIHNLLPDFERDIMTLVFDYNKIQEDIGVILGLSQEMVNYYKKRAIHRILHFFHHRKIDVNDMRECLQKYMSKRQLEAMMLYFFKHNQRIVSKELGISQSAVSARLKQGLKKLKKKSKNDEKVGKYYEVFNNLTKQKSLYSSQTRMHVITDVDNYTQFDENNQRITQSAKPKEPSVQLKKSSKIKPTKQTQKPKVKREKVKPNKKTSSLKLSSQKKTKKIKFNSKKLKNLRKFFKR
jgi:predicted transcriptional regulator